MIADQEAGEAGARDAEPAWEDACRREDAIRELLQRHSQGLTAAVVDEVAGQLGMSRASP